MSSKDKEIIREFYNNSNETEWKRIENRPEFILTCRFLDRYIKPGQRVLDIGGGPGRYSLYLLEKGCNVSLLDLSEGNVSLAREKAAEKGFTLDAKQGDACVVHKSYTEKFDHILLMGPMYHLLEERDRVKAMESALSLLKEGGKIYVSFISMFAGIIFTMKELPEIILKQEEQEFYKSYLQDKSFAGDAFTRAFFIRQQEILPFMEKFPLKKLHLFSQEGVSSPCEENIMKAKPEVVEAWLKLCEQLCEREELLSWGEHLMYIGEKDSLRLVFPELCHKEKALAYRQECFDAGEKLINGDAGLDEADSYEEWLLQIQADLTIPATESKVPATAYFAMVQGEIAGTIQVRHCLNKYLDNYAGHIGYEVAPSKRNRGYARKMLKLALLECKKLGIEKALVTCDRDNLGSAGTIKSCGGILENEVLKDEVPVQRYFIKT